MNGPALSIQNLRKSFGSLVATNDVSLSIEPGEIHALIGPNGAGKTTLISQLSGQLRPTAGSIHMFAEEITALPMDARVRKGIVRSFQITSLCREFSALTNVAMAVQARAGHSFRFLKGARNDPRLTEPARDVLKQVGLLARADIPVGSLAHGEQRQLEIAVALACAPQILVLDEPMAGMGPEESKKVVDLLQSLKRKYTILLVEHDMDAVFALADRISVLVYGQCIATGTPAEIRTHPGVIEAYLGEDDHA